MAFGVLLRVSWICLLLFSSGACFPATKGGYKYPDTTASRSSADVPAKPSSGLNYPSLQPIGSFSSLVSLQHEQAVKDQQPGGEFEPSSPSPASSVTYSALQDAYGLLPYSDVLSPSSGSAAGYVSPPVDLSPTSTGKKSPSVSPQPGPGASSSYDTEQSRFGYFDQGLKTYSAAQGGYAASPVYKVPQFPTSEDTGDGFQYPALSVSTGDGHSYPSYDLALSEGYFPAVEEPAFPSVSTGWEEEPQVYPSFYPSSVEEVYQPEEPVLGTQQSQEMPQSVSEPFLPSSYIVQSRGGYQQAREVFSNTKYSLEVPPLPSPVSKAAHIYGVTGAKVGKGL